MMGSPALRRMLDQHEMVRTTLASAAIVAGRVGSAVATLGYTLLMARTMSPTDVGIVWTVWAVLLMMSTLPTLNVGNAAVRELVHARATGQDDVASGFLRVSNLILLVLALPFMALFVAGFAWFAPDLFAAHRTAIVLAALTLPAMGWAQSNAMIASALGRGVLVQGPRSLVRPVLLVLVFAVAAAADYRPDADTVIVLFAVTSLLGVAAQYVVTRRHFREVFAHTPRIDSWRDWIRSGIALVPSRVLAEHLRNIFILTIAIAGSHADTARMTVGFSMIGLLMFGIAAVEITFNAKISAAIVRDTPRRRDMLLGVSGLLKLLPVLGACVVLGGFAQQVLALFGEAYVVAAPMVQWLLLVPLARAAAGPAFTLLQIARARQAAMLIALFGIAAIIAAIPLGVALFGTLEAGAAGGSLAYCAMQFAAWLFCLRRTGIDGSPLTFVWTEGRRRLSGARA